MLKKSLRIITVYFMFWVLSSCEPVTEYIEVEKEVIVTEFVTETVIEEVEVIVVEEREIIVTETEYVDVFIDVPFETIVTEYVEVEKEIIVTKYIEVDKIIEVITEVEVEKIVTEEKIIEVNVVEYVDNYIEVPVEIVTTEYVDRVETVAEYIDRVEVVTEYIEVEIEKEVIVDRVVEVPVEVVVTETVTEYVDRIETVTEYVDRVETVVEYVEVETIINTETVVEVPITEYVDNMVYTETIVYLTKEIYVLEEPEVIVEPIKEYDNYITTNSKVLGVTQDGFEEIPLIKGLFKLGNFIYFVIDDKKYSQVDGIIAELGILPEIPTSECIEFSSGNYKIQKSVYNDQDISKVYNGSPNVAYYMIDGACLRGSDLIYSTPIDTGTRLKGVYIWTVNGNPLLIMDSGRIW